MSLGITAASSLHLTSQVRGKLCIHCLRHRPQPVRFKIDGKYYCVKHADKFWESHFVENHSVVRF
jgi:hypothetical protein